MSGLPEPARARPDAYQSIPACGHLRIFPIVGDLMEPTFRRGDFALVSPVPCYTGEAMYVIDGGWGGAIYRVSFVPGGVDKPIRLRPDNHLYTVQHVTHAEFEAMVLAIVVIKMNVIERDFLPDELRI